MEKKLFNMIMARLNNPNNLTTASKFCSHKNKNRFSCITKKPFFVNMIAQKNYLLPSQFSTPNVCQISLIHSKLHQPNFVSPNLKLCNRIAILHRPSDLARRFGANTHVTVRTSFSKINPFQLHPAPKLKDLLENEEDILVLKRLKIN